METYFTSDTHFGDMRVLRFDHRPFPDLPSHDEALVARWNETVADNDEVWHLGDFALGPDRARIEALLSALKGRKHLIIGNNDGADTIDSTHWASVQHYAEIAVEGRALVLGHYPFRTWNGIGRGAVNLHGHSHGKLKPITRQYDVGVDVWDFRPVRLAAILSKRRRGPAVPHARSARKAASTQDA